MNTELNWHVSAFQKWKGILAFCFEKFEFDIIKSNIRQSLWYCIMKVTMPSLLAEIFSLQQRRVPSVLPIPHRSLPNHIIHTSSVTAAKCKHNSQDSAKNCWTKYSPQQNSCCSLRNKHVELSISKCSCCGNSQCNIQYVDVGGFQGF